MKAIVVEPNSPLGTWAKKIRQTLKLSQQELAAMTGVSQEEVELFELNYPVKLDARRRLLKDLWAARNILR
jgi:transcriptional regulator with XRE-family HTH domain